MTFEILRATETHANGVVNTARHNLKLNGIDLIVGFRAGVPVELQSMAGISVMTGKEPASIEDALSIYEAHLAEQATAT